MERSPGESRTFNGFLVGGLLGAFAVPNLFNYSGFSSPYEALAATMGLGPFLDPSVLVWLLASHTVAVGAGYLAARTSGVRERLVAFGSVWVGAALFSYAAVAEGAAERAAAGFPTAFTSLLVSTGSWAVFALLGGIVARRRRLRQEGRSSMT